jgi:hypothetical protein
MRDGKPKPAARATKAQVQARVEDVLRIRLDGAEFWDVREWAREQEQKPGSAWERKDGAKPLSDGQLWRYIGMADKLIAESCRASRKKLLRRHLAQRRNLYAKAVSAGDYRAALAAARDEAELLGLYQTSVTFKLTKEHAAFIDHEVARVAAGGASLPPGPAADGRAPPGAAGGPGPDLPPGRDGAGPVAGGGAGL